MSTKDGMLAACIASLAFYCCGIAGASDRYSVVEGLAWATGNFEFYDRSLSGDDDITGLNTQLENTQALFGLTHYWLDYSSGRVKGQWGDGGLCDDDFYSDDAASSLTCEKCSSAASAVGTLSMAIIFGIVASVAAIMYLTPYQHEDNDMGQKIYIGGTVCSFLSLVFAVAAFAHYTTCFQQLKRDDYEPSYGAGFGLTCLGAVLNFLAVVLGLFKISHYTELPASEHGSDNDDHDHDGPGSEMLESRDLEDDESDFPDGNLQAPSLEETYPSPKAPGARHGTNDNRM